MSENRPITPPGVPSDPTDAGRNEPNYPQPAKEKAADEEPDKATGGESGDPSGEPATDPSYPEVPPES